MKNICIVTLFVLIAATAFTQTPTPTPTPTHNPVLEVCSDPQECPYQTINEALEDAITDDTILIKWEDSYTSVYSESIIIDTKITLTSDGTGDDLPLIQADVNDSNTDAVIEVTEKEVTISHLKIRNSDPYYYYSSPPAPTPYATDEVLMYFEAGIMITNQGCKVTDCEITRCRVGILIAPDDFTQDIDPNIISDCRIGGIPDGPDPHWFISNGSDYHDGNFFGVVHYAPDREASDVSFTNYSYMPDEIVNCTIQGNRFYGVVLRNGSQAYVTNNLIIWNGTPDPLQHQHHFGDGGVLSLFTSSEIITGTGDEVDIQSPKIFSNTIFGNNGYQVCVVSENDDYRDISNIPVIMNNNIGPNPFWEATATPGAGGFPHLVSCTSESSDSQTTTQYGSAPVLAFNNVYRDTSAGMAKNYYLHPLQTQLPTFTPTPPTYTPPPTPTPTPPPPTFVFNTPVPSVTALPYQIHLKTWTVNDIYKPHGFVGGTEPSDFDFHLSNPEFQPTPTVTASPRSACLNAGPFDLEPGQTQETPVPDTGWVDLGRHIKPDVPEVIDLDVDVVNIGGTDYYTISWTLPTHYSDSSIFDDAQGNIYYYGHVFIKGQPPTIYGTPEYIDLSSPHYDQDLISWITHLGITVYNNRGEKSDIEWVLRP